MFDRSNSPKQPPKHQAPIQRKAADAPQRTNNPWRDEMFAMAHNGGEKANAPAVQMLEKEGGENQVPKDLEPVDWNRGMPGAVNEWFEGNLFVAMKIPEAGIKKTRILEWGHFKSEGMSEGFITFRFMADFEKAVEDGTIPEAFRKAVFDALSEGMGRWGLKEAVDKGKPILNMNEPPKDWGTMTSDEFELYKDEHQDADKESAQEAMSRTAEERVKEKEVYAPGISFWVVDELKTKPETVIGIFDDKDVKIDKARTYYDVDNPEYGTALDPTTGKIQVDPKKVAGWGKRIPSSESPGEIISDAALFNGMPVSKTGANLVTTRASIWAPESKVDGKLLVLHEILYHLSIPQYLIERNQKTPDPYESDNQHSWVLKSSIPYGVDKKEVEVDSGQEEKTEEVDDVKK